MRLFDSSTGQDPVAFSHTSCGKTRVVHMNKEAYDVRIDRTTPYGNPYSNKEWSSAKYKVTTKAEALKKFRDHVETDEEFQKLILPLKGKVLGCWCGHSGCHGNIIAEFLDRDTKLIDLFSD